MKKAQRGNTIVGIIIGVVLGLAAALAVAVYVTKVPVPFLSKGGGRTAEQDAAESRKNQNWDPNAPLHGKNPARPLPPAPGLPGVPSAPPVATIPAPEAEKRTPEAGTPRAAARPQTDPLGDLAAARSAAPQAAGGDPFLYFVQAGAFRTPDDAEAQRAKLSLMGIEARVTEREQSGRQVWRVRVGPFDKKDEADRQKERLEGSGFDTALVRVQR
ncbi:SPOR domain-containing protein [Ramlibacter sp.]|uniref:SPOR domain-containing protein n=1 Tax=Ramlibacter sp. TaxID=1917967 RepID=UPI0017C212BE|nr:SPOR domain-containing protein [Ramlibacter sp.]MBA2675356.1 SPOR domain-containing protein [Ramlibacter sp.]